MRIPAPLCSPKALLDKNAARIWPLWFSELVGHQRVPVPTELSSVVGEGGGAQQHVLPWHFGVLIGR